LYSASGLLVSRTFAINIDGAKIANSSQVRSSRRNIVERSLLRCDTASIPDALPAVGMMKC
jgi:hypothetical protein